MYVARVWNDLPFEQPMVVEVLLAGTTDDSHDGQALLGELPPMDSAATVPRDRLLGALRELGWYPLGPVPEEVEDGFEVQVGWG